MFEEFERRAKEVIEKILEEKGIKMDKELILDAPTLPYVDASTSKCFKLAKELKASPIKIAEDFVKRVKVKKGFIKDVKAARGYINFYLDYDSFTPELIKKIHKIGKNYGRGKKKDKVILEHTSANPNGPLHIGHARNAIIGDTLARIMKFAGYDIETHYYVNDMGKQIAMVVWGLKKFQSKKEKKDHSTADVYIKVNKAVAENPEIELEISKLMRDYERGEVETKKEFERAVSNCLEGIKETLKEMNIRQDKFVWESRFSRDSSVKKLLKKLEGTEYAKKGEVVSLDLKEFGINKELILVRKDGTSLYPSRDIAYHLWKLNKGEVIDVWGSDHKLATQQLTAALKILGKEKLPEFIIHEFISTPEGAMSTRRGVFISADDLMAESIERAYKEVDKRRPKVSEAFKKSTAKSVGIGAVRFNIVKVSPEKPMVFRWEEALDFERQGSPFLQYAYARACRILEKGGIEEKF